MASNLLIVESPAKAKTLKKYLGGGFEVLASYGHVRDLEAKNGAVDPEHDFAMRYVPVERNKKHLDAIARAAADADTLYLATDPDREGEAIAWHIAEHLRAKKLLKPLKRVAFHEITESAVKNAVAQPRDISMSLVNAQQARRALDHLVGFHLSPLLWRKIAPSLSAGRVQSPALRLIAEREAEIEAFVPREYWSVHLDTHKGARKFSARLIQFRGEKVEQFSLPDAASHQKVLDELKGADTATVARLETKTVSRNPAAPFTTSTLQQEAARKLGFSADRTMRVAQQLYEGMDTGRGTVGLISYMRTDSVALAGEALAEIRRYVTQHYDAEYLPKQPVAYANKSKNAQEAHEAIRPTSVLRTPDAVRGHLNADQAKLYELIWKRTLACQMAPARFARVTADLSVRHANTLFRATGQTLLFPGFIAVYQEGRDDAVDDHETQLPALAEGERLPVDRLFGEQHFTQPPPRYTEASLVKTLEEHGIGRPSTYATILSTLQERDYARLEAKRFKPTAMGRLVTCFLTRHFGRYVDYDFTAKLEDRLDDISTGKAGWVPVLHDFWHDFHGLLKDKESVERGCPLPEACPKCQAPLFLQASRRGPFVGCSRYPECDYTRPWAGADDTEPRELGVDPASGLKVTLLHGRYGPYVQLGEVREGEDKPKRAAWPKNLAPADADLELALKLLSLPREVGCHPETGEPVVANIGRFGPYLLYQGAFKSIPKADSPYDITLERALDVLAQEKSGRGGGRGLGEHPEGGAVELKSGRYGPYVRWGKINASLPADADPEHLSLEQALALIGAKQAAPAKGPVKKAAARKPAAADKAAAKKPAAANKTAAKKTPIKKIAAPAVTTAGEPAAAKPKAGKTSSAAKSPRARKPALATDEA